MLQLGARRSRSRPRRAGSARAATWSPARCTRSSRRPPGSAGRGSGRTRASRIAIGAGGDREQSRAVEPEPRAHLREDEPVGEPVAPGTAAAPAWSASPARRPTPRAQATSFFVAARGACGPRRLDRRLHLLPHARHAEEEVRPHLARGSRGSFSRLSAKWTAAPVAIESRCETTCSAMCESGR